MSARKMISSSEGVIPKLIGRTKRTLINICYTEHDGALVCDKLA